jgi:DNA-binding response OmpR family regulator
LRQYDLVLFDGVGKDWLQFYDGLRTGVSVLVVDDEPVVCRLMEAILAGAGWGVEMAGTAEDAWARIQNEPFGLLVTDKNLPGKSGVELISAVKAAGIDLPSLVITGYASVESVSNALAAGASDYITKPFHDVDHVRKRAASIVERQVQTRLYNRMVRDLARVVTQGGKEQELVKAIARELFAFKQRLAERPELMLVAPEGEGTDDIAQALMRAGHSVRIESTKEDALAAVNDEAAPLAAIASLQLKFPVTLVADLIHRDPLLGVLATSDSPRLTDALAAVEAGASDFFIRGVESIEALEVRAQRAIENSRRSRLYLHLLAILHRAATEQGHQIAGNLWQLLSEEHRDYLQAATAAPESLLPEVDVGLAEIFDDEHPDERRTHPRVSAQQVEVWFRPVGSKDPFARGRLRDVSCGGFFLRADPPLLNRGTAVEAHLLVHGEPPASAIEVTGRVVRTEMHDPDPERLSGNGILVDEACHGVLDVIVRRVAD